MMAHGSSFTKHLWRPLLIWLGSVILAGTLLVLYCGMPVGPLWLAGGVTLAITIGRIAWARGAR